MELSYNATSSTQKMYIPDFIVTVKWYTECVDRFPSWSTTAFAVERSFPANDQSGTCYISITHVNSVSVSVYHVTICQQTPFRDAQQLTTILSSSLCSLRHPSEILWATLKSYLMSLLFGHHQWISTRTLYSSFQPSTLHFRVRACMEQSLLFITCIFHVSAIPCSYILSTHLS